RSDMSEINDAIKAAMKESNDYGEPWRRENDGSVLNRHGHIAVCCRERIVACVNALAGRDPEKLEGLLEAVKTVVVEDSRMEDGQSVHDFRPDIIDLANALAAFEGRGE